MKKLFLVLVFTLFQSYSSSTLAQTQALDDAILYNADNFVDKTAEQKILNEAEQKTVELIRKNASRNISTAVITINRASLENGIITMMLPFMLKQYQFIGASERSRGANARVWSGRAKSGATFVFAEDDQGAYGIIRDAGKFFEINALPGKKYYVITESIAVPMQEFNSSGGAGSEKK